MPQIILGDIATPSKISRRGRKDVPFLSMSSEFGLIVDNRYRIDNSTAELSKIVKFGQLVTGLHIDEGSIWIQNKVEEGSVSSAYGVYNVDLTKVDPDYLNYALHTPRCLDYYINSGIGNNMRRCKIPWESLSSMPIWLPSIEEQKSCVLLMDTIKKLEEKIHQAITIISTAESRLLTDYLDDPITKDIEDVSLLTFGRNPLSEHIKDTEQLPICSGTSDFGDVFTEFKKKVQYYDRVVEPGTVLLSVRYPVGKVNIASERCAIGRGVVGFEPIHGVSETIFLYLSLKNKESELDSISYGIIKGIGPKEIKGIKIDYISLDKQNELSAVFYRFESIRTILKNMLTSVSKLEQRVLQEMFSHEVIA